MQSGKARTRDWMLDYENLSSAIRHFVLGFYRHQLESSHPSQAVRLPHLISCSDGNSSLCLAVLAARTAADEVIE